MLADNKLEELKWIYLQKYEALQSYSNSVIFMEM